MEFTLDDENLVNNNSINFVYLKNELGKLLGFKLPENIDSSQEELFKKIYNKVQEMDQNF